MANGHSSRMATALLVLPAGPSSLLPIRWRWCVEGRGAAVRPEPLTRAHLSLWFAGSSWGASGSFGCPGVPHSVRVSLATLFSPSRGGWLVRRGTHPSRTVCACALSLRTSRCSWSVPGFDPKGARFRAGGGASRSPACLPCSVWLRCFVSRLAGPGERKKGGRGGRREAFDA